MSLCASRGAPNRFGIKLQLRATVPLCETPFSVVRTGNGFLALRSFVRRWDPSISLLYAYVVKNTSL